MKIIDLNLPDQSDHPPPPRVSLGVYEKWMFDALAAGVRPPMTDEEIRADFLKNEGSQKEPWPDFGAMG